MSEEITQYKDAHEALCYIQQNIKVPKLRFSKYMDTSYRNNEDIYQKVKPLLKNATLRCDMDVLCVAERLMMKATAILEVGQTSVQCSGFAWLGEKKAKMDEGQTTGSASSYAEKNALGSLFLLDDSVDLDSLDNDQKGIKALDIKLIEELQELIDRKGSQVIKVCEAFNVDALCDLNVKQYETIKKQLSARPDVSA